MISMNLIDAVYHGLSPISYGPNLNFFFIGRRMPSELNKKEILDMKHHARDLDLSPAGEEEQPICSTKSKKHYLIKTKTSP